MAGPLRPSLDFHTESLTDGNVLGLVGTAYGPAQAIKPVGLTGATNPTRYVGGETSGHPTTGTFIAGDYVVTADGHIWVCSTGGSPGTWVDIAGSGGSGVAVQDEGSALGTATTMNFTGTGVTATFAGSTATVNVPGGGGGGSAILAIKAGTGNSWATTTSATYADLDATNLVVTFTAPSSGQVLVALNALAYASSTAGACSWNLRDSLGDVTGTTCGITTAGSSTAWSRYQTAIVVSGLTSGNSYTWKWGFASTSTSTTAGTFRGGSGFPATMTVFSA